MHKVEVGSSTVRKPEPDLAVWGLAVAAVFGLIYLFQKSHKKDTKVRGPAVASGTEEKPAEHEVDACQRGESMPLKFESVMEKPKYDSLTVWGFGVTVLIAIIYFFQLLVMGGQLNEARKQTHWAERPWLRFRYQGEEKGVPQSLNLTSFEPIIVPAEFMNIGNSPALRAQGVTVIEVVSADHDPDFPKDISRPRETNASGPIFIDKNVGTEFASGVIYPAQPAKFQTKRVQSKDGSAIPWELSQDELDNFLDGKTYIAVWGKVWYMDGFGTEHWARFCHETAYADSVIKTRKCLDYNDADNEDGTWLF